MKKIASVLITVMISALLFGCSGTEYDTSSEREKKSGDESTDAVMYFNLYSGEEIQDSDVTEVGMQSTDLYEGSWDLKNGTVSIDFQEKVFHHKGNNPYSVVASWDGERRYLLKERGEITEKNPRKEFLPAPTQEKESAVSALICGDGYSFSLSDDLVPSLRLGDDEEPIIFPSLSHQIEIDGESFTTTDSTDFWLLGSGVDQNDLYLLWGVPKKSKVTVSRLSAKEKEITWTDDYDVSVRYQDLIFSSYITLRPFIDRKFYFSLSDTIGCFDVETGEFSDFREETSSLDSMIPGTSRRVFSEEMSLVDIIGCSKDTVIGLLQYQDDYSDKMHNVCFAIREEQLSGAFCSDLTQENLTITTYGKDLKKREEKVFNEVSGKQIEILWQNPNYYY